MMSVMVGGVTRAAGSAGVRGVSEQMMRDFGSEGAGEVGRRVRGQRLRILPFISCTTLMCELCSAAPNTKKRQLTTQCVTLSVL